MMKHIQPAAFREALAVHMIFHAAGVDIVDIFVAPEAIDPTTGEVGLGVTARRGDLTFMVVVGPHGIARDAFKARWAAAVEALSGYTDEEARRLLESTEIRKRVVEVFAAMAAKGFEIASPMQWN